MDEFVYYRRKTLSSFLWSTWLRFPQRFRYRLYSFLLTFARTSSNAPDLKVLPLLGLYAKRGGDAVIQEALSLQFIVDYTSIRVPEVLDLLDPNDDALGPIMIMSRLPGTPLSRTSLNSLSHTQQTKIADTLRDWLNQLQYLYSPYGRLICGYLGGRFTSYRINSSPSPSFSIGPYTSQNTFHEEPCCALREEHDGRVRSLGMIIRQKRYDICFVHGNLGPENLMVDRESGELIGLVGWECAAYMPSYWDLTSGCWGMRGREGEEVWRNVLVRCLPQYVNELKVEREIWKTYRSY